MAPPLQDWSCWRRACRRARQLRHRWSRRGRPQPQLPAPRLERLGGGWGTFVAFEDAQYWAPPTGFYRHNAYGLRNDGKLFRWIVETKGVWHSSGSYAGFSSVKSMALISKTRTYAAHQ